MSRLVFALIGLVFTAFAGVAHAALVRIDVAPVGYDAGVRQMLANAATVANAEVRGAGESIVFSYSAARPLTVLVFFHGKDEPLAIATALRGTLPAAENGEAEFPLTYSTGWRPGERAYQVYLVSDDETGADVRSATTAGGSSAQLPVIALSQMFSLEPFQPSLYHRLQGYRVFGHPLLPIIGVCVLVIVAALCWKRPRWVLPLLACALLLYGLRFSLDLGRYSAAHLTEWTGRGTYAQAGSVSAIADAIRADAGSSDPSAAVLVCSAGTSYVPTLLTYLLYPMPVTSTIVRPPTYVVVAESIGAEEDAATVTCDGQTLTVRELREFTDGSILYRVAA